MSKSILAIGLIFILIFSTFIPVSFGSNLKSSSEIEPRTFSSNDDIDWWPMEHHDLQHTGYSTSFAGDYLYNKWTYKSGSALHSLTISYNKIYVGSNDDNVYCLNANNGEVIWSYKTGSTVVSAPAEYYNRLYFGSIDSKVYCLRATDGDFIWSYDAGSSIKCSPVVYDDKVYIGSESGEVYCLDDMNGELIWSYKTDDPVRSSPAIYDDKVYVGSFDGKMYCFNATDGKVVWIYNAWGGLIWGSPTIYDGKVFFGTVGHKMLCLNATNGAVIWKKDKGREIICSPAIANDYIYVVCYDDWRIFCLNVSNGEEIWRYKAGYFIDSSPSVADGKVYFISIEHLLYCLNSLTGEVLWTYRVSGQNFNSPVIADGIIYISTLGGKVHAFGTQEFNNPPESPSITGSKRGKPNIKYDFNFQSFDPDKNPISYYVDWGDGTNTGWLEEYASGQDITLSHTWIWEDMYTIKAKAKDTFGLESDETSFEIKISNPRTRTSYWLRFFDMFPILQRLLGIIL